MYTVRMLIKEAYRKSTVRGLTDEPEADEVTSALETLNTELDLLTSREEFTTSKRAVSASVNSEGYFTIAENPKRIITSATRVSLSRWNVTTKDVNGLSVGDEIRIYFDQSASAMFTYTTFTVESLTSPYEFVAYSSAALSPSQFSGQFVLPDEGPEYKMDIIDLPPDNIYQVVGTDGVAFPELQEQDFYANRQHKEFKWYFYDKSRNPYPRVWIGGAGTVTVVYVEPFWHDLTLDTDLTAMPKAALTVIKFLLASDLAYENGYEDIGRSNERRFKEAYADYVRSMSQSASPIPDISAPGYFHHGGYNIENDGVGNGWGI